MRDDKGNWHTILAKQSVTVAMNTGQYGKLNSVIGQPKVLSSVSTVEVESEIGNES